MWDERHVELLTRAAELNRASLRLDELFGGLDEDVREWARFEAEIHGEPRSKRVIDFGAVKASHEYELRLSAWRAAVEAVYTEDLMGAVEALRAQDRSGISDSLVFLEADPWCFRSGYFKQRILRLLRSVELGPDDRARLQDALTTMVKAGPRMEFREACRTAKVCDTPDFRRRLAYLSGWLHGAGTRERAGWMLAALDRR